MKNIILVILAAVLWACQGDQKKSTNENESESAQVSEVMKWLEYEGTSEEAKKIVFVSGDEEYRSEEALPQLAKILNKHHGFECTVLFAQNPETPGIIDPTFMTNIPGLESLEDADLMVIFTRFRALPDEQMQHIDDFLKRGGSVIGIRTSTHAFKFDSTSNFAHYGNYYNGPKENWAGGFGRFVLGEKWISHHGHHRHQSTRGIIAEESQQHPIVNGISNGDIWGPTDVYGVRLPMPETVQPVILGQVINRPGEYDENDEFYGMRESDSEVATVNPARKDGGNPNDPMMPVAWMNSYQLEGGKTGKVFTSTIGSSTDMANEGVRRLLVNAAFWAMDLEVPEKAAVDIVGSYSPTAYEFKKKEDWLELAPKVSDKY